MDTSNTTFATKFRFLKQPLLPCIMHQGLESKEDTPYPLWMVDG
jgi:hypothetical protein